jgi:hypothetical protein
MGTVLTQMWIFVAVVLLVALGALLEFAVSHWRRRRMVARMVDDMLARESRRQEIRVLEERGRVDNIRAFTRAPWDGAAPRSESRPRSR